MSNLTCPFEIKSDKGISFEESLFIAEEQTYVDIIPNIKMEKKLIFSVEIGPFIPYQKSKVPLWIAKYLDSKNLCKLIPPNWLTQEGLRKLLVDEDKLGQETFCFIDFYYYQIANIYFQLRNDPFNGKKSKVKKLFQDLINRRQAKLKANYKHLTLPKALDVSNLGLIELNFGSNECFHTLSDLQNLWINTLPINSTTQLQTQQYSSQEDEYDNHHYYAD
ncbi:Uncharacterized protein cpbgf_1003410 [Cryptosporidium parvum]|uniref:GINS subunit domain-containing protein n=1 Tax=Cryptosporidium parvum TaxID=5807 RepID=A0A7S7LJG3_CRYPV|nr:Uncharacterized protein CPATCC_0035870 [Cryptosporidium parvum]WRK30739.1 Uncharacterized protein cpbgf_1003410 [Cryptosporidium parvum]|eukprot:QOY43282.1 hypothetical protein CPATCC_000052 [Cryptosporidium parvum]